MGHHCIAFFPQKKTSRKTLNSRKICEVAMEAWKRLMAEETWWGDTQVTSYKWQKKKILFEIISERKNKKKNKQKKKILPS